MTFDLDLWPTDLNINRGHLLIRTIYLPSLKILGQSVLELSVAQGEVDWHDFDLNLWPTDLNINRGHILIKDYLPTKFEAFWVPSLKILGQSVLDLSVAQGEVDWHDLWPWPTDLNINRGHLLMKDYLPTKFEDSGAKRSRVISCTRWSRLAWPLTLTFDLLTWISIRVIYSSRTSWAKHSWVISCTRLRDTDIPTDIPTDMCKAICPSFFKGGHNNIYCQPRHFETLLNDREFPPILLVETAFTWLYLRVSTLQMVFCGVFGGFLFLAMLNLTSADVIKSSNYECVNLCEGKFPVI